MKIIILGMMLITSLSASAKIGSSIQKINFAKPLIVKNLTQGCTLIEESLNIGNSFFNVVPSALDPLLRGETDENYIEFLSRCKSEDDHLTTYYGFIRVSVSSAASCNEKRFIVKKGTDLIRDEKYIICTDKNVDLHLEEI